MTDATLARPPAPLATVYPVLLAVSLCHLLNDVMQSLIAAIYPMLKDEFALDFWQIGLLTMVFQVTAAALQPLVGFLNDRKPRPFALPVAMGCTAAGLGVLAMAPTYPVLLMGGALVGVGSAIFHPESSRVARAASGGQFGLAQSLFQVGGNIGSAIGPLLAATIVLPMGRGSVGWFILAAMLGLFILTRVAIWARGAASKRKAMGIPHGLPREVVRRSMAVLVALVFTKFVYLAALSSYFTFFVIERFGMSTDGAQMMLFIHLAGVAVGTFVGGPIGDRIGRRAVIWVSILGALPFALLLPHVGLWSTAVLSFVVGMIMASAFSAMVVFAQELSPGRVGTVAGLFFGLAFGIGGIGAALLGVLIDAWGIQRVFVLVSFLPALGMLAALLPRLPR
jgi:FSR family fosmidomycin resistance protein-like MFS transporter